MTDYPHFYRPILKPMVPPAEENTENICIQVDKKWQPYILTMLTALAIERTWESDGARVSREANDLLHAVMLADCPEPGTPEEGDCVDYTPQNAPIWWGPTNPFINPGDIPPGYLSPPWRHVTDPGIFGLLGFQVGDVFTLQDAFPIGIPPLHNDLPKLRVYCFGTGTVELHLLEIPYGGIAIITQDDNILTLKIVELEHSVGEVPIESVALRIVEIEFTTGGSHHIDVMFERRIDPTSFIPVGFGGGLRKVVLCGFDLPGESVDVRQNVDAPCTLEKSADGETWVPFADLQLCPPKIRTDKGKLQIQIGGIWIDLDGGGDERFDGSAETPYPDPIEGETGSCLAAENITAQFLTMLTQLHNGLLTGAVATLGGTIAASLAAVVLFPIALIGAAVLGIVAIGNSIGAASVEAITESDAIDTFKCIIACEADDDGSITAAKFEFIKDEIESQIGGSTAGIMFGWLDSLGPVGMTRLAASAGITTGDCDDCDCGWESILDFTADSYAALITVLNGSYDGANGYIGTPASGQYYSVNLQLNFTSAEITYMQMVYTAGGGSGASAGHVFYHSGPSWAFYGSVQALGSGSHIELHHSEITTSGAWLLSGGTGDTDAPFYVEKWIIRGNGTKPSELP